MELHGDALALVLLSLDQPARQVPRFAFELDVMLLGAPIRFAGETQSAENGRPPLEMGAGITPQSRRARTKPILGGAAEVSRRRRTGPVAGPDQGLNTR
jgi:hypothetical protein